MNERSKWRFENLMDATGERTKSGAIDVAADYYLKMSGSYLAVPNGAIPRLMKQAVEKGSLTPTEIAEILHTDELPVEYSYEWSTGPGE